PGSRHRRSYHIRSAKTVLGAPKIGDAEPQKQRDNPEAKDETRSIEPGLAAQYAPAEAVDHRRNVEPELDNEKDDVAKIAILHVECHDQECQAEARQHCQSHESWEQCETPTRPETVPHLQPEQD